MVLSDAERDRLILHRQHFPTLAHKTYFNFGGQGTMPTESIVAIQTAHQTLQELGPFSWDAWVFGAKETENTRQGIANELQVSPKTISLTQNVLSGCNIPLWGMDWQAGDHILLSDCEYPAVIATVQELQHRFGIDYSFCPLMDTLNEGDPLAVMGEHLRPTTRLVILSHVLWNTGQVLPLKEMIEACHAYSASPSSKDIQTGNSQEDNAPKIRVLVDAAQSVGMLPLNVADLNVDFYAFTGHKWWCGPAGLGALYIHPEAYHAIRPTFIGWRGVIKDKQGNPVGFHDDGQRFEVSTYDVTSMIALREAIDLQNQWGTAEERYHRLTTLSAYLLQQLQAIPQLYCFRIAPPESGLVFFQLKGVESMETDNPHRLFVKELAHQGFLLRTILTPDCMRACVNYLTLESEIDALVETIQTLLPKFIL